MLMSLKRCSNIYNTSSRKSSMEHCPSKGEHSVSSKGSLSQHSPLEFAFSCLSKVRKMVWWSALLVSMPLPSNQQIFIGHPLHARRFGHVFSNSYSKTVFEILFPWLWRWLILNRSQNLKAATGSKHNVAVYKPNFFPVDAYQGLLNGSGLYPVLLHPHLTEGILLH
jgi:hypothetical protein